MSELEATEISGVAEAVLYVSDLARSKAFYTAVLGLPNSYTFAESCFLQTGTHSTIILFDLTVLNSRQSIIPAHGATGAGHVCLAVPPEQMDAWRERLLAHGVEIEHEQDWPQGTHSIYFRDPDGNSLELIDGRHYSRVAEILSKRDLT